MRRSKSMISNQSVSGVPLETVSNEDVSMSMSGTSSPAGQYFPAAASAPVSAPIAAPRRPATPKGSVLVRSLLSPFLSLCAISLVCPCFCVLLLLSMLFSSVSVSVHPVLRSVHFVSLPPPQSLFLLSLFLYIMSLCSVLVSLWSVIYRRKPPAASSIRARRL